LEAEPTDERWRLASGGFLHLDVRVRLTQAF
jgi:hypothetical protein